MIYTYVRCSGFGYSHIDFSIITHVFYGWYLYSVPRPFLRNKGLRTEMVTVKIYSVSSSISNGLMYLKLVSDTNNVVVQMPFEQLNGRNH